MECQVCYDSTKLIKCDCGFEVCEECIKQTYLMNVTPKPKCVKCAKTLPYYLLTDLSFYRSEYVRRFVKHTEEEVKKRVDEARQAGEIKKSASRVLANKIGREPYQALVAGIRSRLAPADLWTLAVTRAMVGLTGARTVEALRYELGILDNVFGGREFQALLDDQKDVPQVAFVCPWEGCSEGVLRTPNEGLGQCRNSHESCMRCRRPLREGHACLEEDVASVELLEKTSKACPSCFCQVEKAEGCDVMYCTKCGTGFDWVTLAIRTSNVHNPHAYETPVTSTRLTPDERGELEARLETLDDEVADHIIKLTNMYLEVVESPREGLENVYKVVEEITESLAAFRQDASTERKVQKGYERIEILATDLWRRVYVEGKLQDILLEVKMRILKAASREIDLDPDYIAWFGERCLEAQPKVWS